MPAVLIVAGGLALVGVLSAIPSLSAAAYEPRVSIRQPTMTTRADGLTASGLLLNDGDRPLAVQAGDPHVPGTEMLDARIDGQPTAVIAPHAEVPVSIALRVTDCSHVPHGHLDVRLNAQRGSDRPAAVTLHWPAPPPGWCAG